MRRLQWLAARRPSQTRPAVVMAVLGLVMTACSSVPAVTPGIASRPVAPAAAPAPAARQGDVLASLPLAFEPVGGEGFASRGPGFSVALSPVDARVAVDGGSFRLRPSGPTANPAARLVGRDPLPGTVTRLQGDDAARWSAGVPTYGAVVAGQVWPGVDMVWHGDQRHLEHDMVVGPGVDPSVVALDVDGADGLTIDGAGDLVIDLGGTTSRMARPILYQDVAGERRVVTGSFLLLGPSGPTSGDLEPSGPTSGDLGPSRIGFQVGAYDATRPLVIDPTLVTSTYLGGSGADNGYGITRDKEGNTYVVGATESNDFPTLTPLQAKLALASAAGGPNSDVFVAKINPSGTGAVWSTYLGGGGRDTGYGVAVGPDGAVYVAGATESVDFPLVKAAQGRYGGGASDGFVAKIAANGTALEWSTFLGGSQTDRVRGLAVDPSGGAYVTGSTSSVDFPSISAQQGGPYRPDDVDAFVAKLPATGTALVYATRLGGSNDDHGLAVAVDSQGSAFVTGDTLSPGFPTVRPFQSGSGGSASGVAGSFPDAFVAKYNPTGSALVYSTFLGGSDFDQGTAIAIDGSGAAYVTGNTNSPNFPTAGPLQARKDGDTDAFVAKLDPPGSTLVYATYYGGSGADGGNAIAVDPAGGVVVAGTTGSPNLPMTRPVQPAKAGGSDAFVLRLNAAGNAPLFATFLGGRDEDQAMGVALNAQGMVHVLGLTSSGDFPTAKPLSGTRAGAAGDAFLSGVSLADATVPVAVPAAPGSSSSHDRRLRALGILTLLLLVLALAQTAYLRRRDRAAPVARPVPAGAGRSRPGATAGLKVLSEDLGPSGPTSGDPDVTVVTGTPPSKAAAGTAVGAGVATSGGPA